MSTNERRVGAPHADPAETTSPVDQSDGNSVTPDVDAGVVLDDRSAIDAVLVADDSVLNGWQRRQPALLAALRELRPCAEVDAVRTLAAAARVERRRRAAAQGLAQLLAPAARE